jgi:hypothetical protein
MRLMQARVGSPPARLCESSTFIASTVRVVIRRQARAE